MLPKPDVKRSAITLRRTTAAGHRCHPSARELLRVHAALGCTCPKPHACWELAPLTSHCSEELQNSNRKPSQAQAGPRHLRQSQSTGALSSIHSTSPHLWSFIPKNFPSKSTDLFLPPFQPWHRTELSAVLKGDLERDHLQGKVTGSFSNICSALPNTQTNQQKPDRPHSHRKPRQYLLSAELERSSPASSRKPRESYCRRLKPGRRLLPPRRSTEQGRASPSPGELRYAGSPTSLKPRDVFKNTASVLFKGDS